MDTTKLPVEVLLIIGTYCAYPDLINLRRTNRYLYAALQSVLDSHKAMIDKYSHVIVHDSGYGLLPDEIQHYPDPLLLLDEVRADSLILGYVKHLQLGGGRDGDSPRFIRWPNGHSEFFKPVNEAWHRVDSAREFWLQTTTTQAAKWDVDRILRYARKARGRSRHPHTPHFPAEYSAFLAMLILVLPELRHLEMYGIYDLVYSLGGPLRKSLDECVDVHKKSYEYWRRSKPLPPPAFQSLTRLTVRCKAHESPLTTQDLINLAILPCVRRLDCHGVVERKAVPLDWSLAQPRGIDPSWEQVFFHNCDIPYAKLKKFCTPLRRLVKVQYSEQSADDETDMEEYLKKFTLVSKRTLGKLGFTYQLVEVEGESSIALVAERDGKDEFER